MVKSKIYAVILVSLVFLAWMFVVEPASAGELTLQRDASSFNSEREARLEALKGLPLEEALKRLQDPDFVSDMEFMDRAAFSAFGHRRLQAIYFAMANLTLPLIEITDERILRRHADFQIARSILQVFPSQAIQPLLYLYGIADPLTKGNMIRAVGKIDDRRIDTLLIAALDDKSFREEENPEVVGDPLRVCDEAYNQIVLHFKVTDVPRTIGNATAIEDRDDSIAALKILVSRNR